MNSASRLIALALLVLTFAWPDLSVASRGTPGSYALVTIAATILLSLIVVSWRDRPSPTRARALAVPVAIGLAAAGALIAAALRWTELMAWLPYHADMLIVIREATRRLLNGHNPYATYRSWDAPWDMAMPYGPVLWAPFAAAQLAHADMRFVTIVGELFVPAWCGVCAALESTRGRAGAGAAWLVLMAALLLTFDVQRFTLIGHTPAYWPWLLPFTAAVSTRRWTAAGCFLAILVVARLTMVAIVPVMIVGVWHEDRARLRPVLIAFAVTGGLLLAPFVVWDVRALWASMVLSYPRVMKAAVWPVLAKPGLETIGITEWLLERGHDGLVVPVQIGAMIGTYAVAWAAIARGRPALPWMALALFVFSMTTLYPVHYLYYDVVLLLACAAAPTVTLPGAARSATWFVGSLLALTLLVFACMAATTWRFPDIVVGDAATNRALRGGFSGIEHEGPRGFAWIVGHDARIAVPRASAVDADILLTAESALDAVVVPQHLTAILNGTLVADTAVPPGRRQIRLAVPRSVWWIGFNDLHLTLATTQSPHDAGTGTDSRPLALAVSRIKVTPTR